MENKYKEIIFLNKIELYSALAQLNKGYIDSMIDKSSSTSKNGSSNSSSNDSGISGGIQVKEPGFSRLFLYLR